MVRVTGKSRRRCALSAAAAAAVMIGAVGCAGGAGGAAGGAGGGGEGSGFEFGASQSEVGEAIAGLDPVTLTFQPAAASESAPGSQIALDFKEKIEERSNGQITVDIVWNHAAASIEDTEAALADGRVDVSHSVPIYKPNEFTGINDLSTLMGAIGGSPMQDELLANSVMAELAWNSEQLLGEYEEAGLVPLVPAYGGGYYALCSEPGSSAQDWDGRQLRIASTAQAAQAEAIGSVPTSMEYTELFEAMQRGTVNCTSMQLNTAAIAGLFEVAPNISYTEEVSFTRALSATLAGSNFKKLPLAYQQIVFDNSINEFAVTMDDFFATGSEGIGQAKDLGGEIEEFDQETVDALSEASEKLISEVSAAGTLGEDAEAALADSIEKWSGEIEELGLEDKGPLAEFDEWYDGSAEDYAELGRAVYEAGALEHRPN